MNNDAESGLRQRLFLDGEADFDDDNAIESDGELSEMDSRLDFEVRMVTQVEVEEGEFSTELILMSWKELPGIECIA